MKNPKIKRIYHNYELWEEFKFGMWNKLKRNKESEMLHKAIEFTGNANLYGEFMLRVTREWKYSCEQNLSHTNLNRQAWIGHAACCLAIGCPEYITRLAWHNLTEEQQIKANIKADEAIFEWEKCQNTI